ncbi:hypothetical protein I553_4273 [Mycobacterium xenopi 4042]|uniref:Uncharacterized protein n=1 Tax=Mycobacterium xenopi 4042 TaxID=1299334 RepID=X8AG70_MYCXE|nr:hypothetical protein I553_4273 [Mycobacterium xenopi 4042]
MPGPSGLWHAPAIDGPDDDGESAGPGSASHTGRQDRGDRRAGPAVTVTGAPEELLLFAVGRDARSASTVPTTPSKRSATHDEACKPTSPRTPAGESLPHAQATP